MPQPGDSIAVTTDAGVRLRAGVLIAIVLAFTAICSWGAGEPRSMAAGGSVGDPAQVGEPVDYHRDIRPMFLKHCYVCHGPAQQEGGLRLDERAGAMRGGDSGPAIVKGSSDESLLIQYVTGNNDSGIIMPPEGESTPLDDDQIARLRQWIEQGAPWPDVPGREVAGGRRSDHWAFASVQPVKPPIIHHPWIDSPIDAFVLARLQAQGMTPNPRASRTELIRRVSFDLIGLPPRPADVQVFLNDTSPEAYERLVDGLLSSPRYGERWARHWLDLARYADSDGFENDVDRPHAYKYRDYLIKSFNADKPYDQFVVEQLAGDEADPNNPDVLTALGFCRAGPSITNQKNEKNRVDEVDDVVTTTGAVFLGLTIGCARCHDHKYEPISQRDYYRVFAVFDNAKKVDDGEILHIRDPGLSARKTHLMIGGDPARLGDEVQPGLPVALDNGRAIFPPPSDLGGSVGRRLALARWIVDPQNPLTARVIVNRIWMQHFGRGLVNSPSNLGPSGEPATHPDLLDYLAADFVQHGWRLKRLHKQIVMSATYRQSSAVDPMKAGLDPFDELYSRYPLRRLDAEAIRDAMLTAAGTLNTQMYGPGIKPRIPDSIRATGSKEMWPRVELETPEHWRRSVYIFAKRTLPMPMLEGFDAPTGTQTCERRMTTTVATQALQLLNDEFSNEQAEHMAARVMKDAHELPLQVERAYWLALSRPPTEAESLRAVAFVRLRVQEDRSETGEGMKPAVTSSAVAHRKALADLCHVLFNSNEFIYIN